MVNCLKTCYGLRENWISHQMCVAFLSITFVRSVLYSDKTFCYLHSPPWTKKIRRTFMWTVLYWVHFWSKSIRVFRFPLRPWCFSVLYTMQGAFRDVSEPHRLLPLSSLLLNWIRLDNTTTGLKRIQNLDLLFCTAYIQGSSGRPDPWRRKW